MNLQVYYLVFQKKKQLENILCLCLLLDLYILHNQNNPYLVFHRMHKTFLFFYQNKKGGWHEDLKKIAVCQLNKLGITAITQSPYCTYENTNLFYSYRRDGETGRMASMIWLTE